MKKATLLTLVGLIVPMALSFAAQAQVASVDDSRPMGLVPANTQISFSKTVSLPSDTEKQQLVNGGVCQFNYDKMPVNVTLTHDTPVTILAGGDGSFLYGQVDELPLTISMTVSCASGTTIGELETELMQIGAQLVLPK